MPRFNPAVGIAAAAFLLLAWVWPEGAEPPSPPFEDRGWTLAAM